MYNCFSEQAFVIFHFGWRRIFQSIQRQFQVLYVQGNYLHLIVQRFV